MRQINQRAATFPGNALVENNFYGMVGEWRVYIGRPAIAGGDTFAIAFNTRTGAIAQGLRSGIRPSPAIVGEEALHNFTLIYP